METIFDYNPTEKELLEIIGTLISKEDYVNKYLPKESASKKLELGFLALYDLSCLFDSGLRNDRKKAILFGEQMEKKYPESWNTYYNE